LRQNYSNCHKRKKHTATQISIFLNFAVLNTVYTIYLDYSTQFWSCFEREGSAHLLFKSQKVGGRRLGADLRHRRTNCVQGKCSLHTVHRTFLSSQANISRSSKLPEHVIFSLCCHLLIHL